MMTAPLSQSPSMKLSFLGLRGTFRLEEGDRALPGREQDLRGSALTPVALDAPGRIKPSLVLAVPA